MYSSGRGVEKNHTKAFELFQKAADAGSRDALFNVALYYRQGWGNVTKVRRRFSVCVTAWPLLFVAYCLPAHSQHPLLPPVLTRAGPGKGTQTYGESGGTRPRRVDGHCWSSLPSRRQRGWQQVFLGVAVAVVVAALVPGPRLLIALHNLPQRVFARRSRSFEHAHAYLKAMAQRGAWGGVLREGFDLYLGADDDTALVRPLLFYCCHFRSSLWVRATDAVQ